MHMFRFWSSDARGSDKTPLEAKLSMLDASSKPLHVDIGNTNSVSERATSGRPPKRRRQSVGEPVAPRRHADAQPSPKRARPDCEESPARETRHDATADLDAARDVIKYQFGLEILLKHDELRLIDQELAKCQVALEQLRRCHLIPYPTTCPTPQQMLDISSGKGPAVQRRPGEPIPKWAPPFGVLEGPYARHYARWLIPDPVFDGGQADWQPFPEALRSKGALDGRAARNGFIDVGGFGKRPVRGATGQKLQALSSGYPQPKDKNGPCVLKRSDGQTVKLVCNDCHRENFSSTQGFINHCRIAHRKEFKSHEEAAVHCGHPLDLDEGGTGAGGDERQGGSAGSGLVHPFARHEPMSEQQAYTALLSRLDASLKLYYEGKLPNVVSIPGQASAPAPAPPSAKSARTPKFVGASDTPYLSRLLGTRKFDGDLSARVADAKTVDDFDDDLSGDEESDDSEQPPRMGETPVPIPAIATARTPAVMRVPARTSIVPLPIIPNARPTSRKGHVPVGLAGPRPSTSTTTTAATEKEEEHSVMFDDDDMDADLSPNTLASNNAPSLVSDDGEYDDDSDDGSTAGTSEEDAESMSDVAEITLDDDQDAAVHQAARDLRHHRGSANTAVKLKKDEAKHVTFMSPVTAGRGKGRRKEKA